MSFKSVALKLHFLANFLILLFYRQFSVIVKSVGLHPALGRLGWRLPQLPLDAPNCYLLSELLGYLTGLRPPDLRSRQVFRLFLFLTFAKSSRPVYLVDLLRLLRPIAYYLYRSLAITGSLHRPPASGSSRVMLRLRQWTGRQGARRCRRVAALGYACEAVQTFASS